MSTQDVQTSSFAIRCRSCTPASTAELTAWLEGKVVELRQQASPQAVVRLSRLTQDLCEEAIDDGWLIEFELPEDEADDPRSPFDALLEEALRDMRILGLAPTVLVGSAAGPP